MRRRAEVYSTRAYLSVRKIIDIVRRFPLLHAYGIGLDMFREVPEQYRMRAVDYAKFMLAYELDDEIDGAALFFRKIDGPEPNKSFDYVRGSYLLYIYSYWRKISGHHPEVMPVGAFIVGALITGKKIRIHEGLKPDFLVSMKTMRRAVVERFLEENYDFRRWPLEAQGYEPSLNDDRVDEYGNEPGGVDAVEQEKGE